MTYDEFIEDAARRVAEHDIHPYEAIWDPLVYHLVREGSARFGAAPEIVWSAIDARVRQREGKNLGRALKYRALDAWGQVNYTAYHLTLAHWHRYLYMRKRRREIPRLAIPAASAPVPVAPRRPPQGRSPKIAIVMLNLNRKEYVEHTLDYFHATIDYDDYELIVVDNGSTDGSRELLCQATQRGLVHKLILRSRNHGISPSINCGFAAADPRVRFYTKLDCDTAILTPGWVQETIRVFERHPDIGLLALNLINDPSLRNIPSELLDGIPVMDWNNHACGSCMTLSRKAFEDVGYLNEGFESAYMLDDVDYLARLHRAGYRGYYFKDLFAYHQFYLDKTQYRSYVKRKTPTRVLMQATMAMARRYDQGRLPIKLVYERYRDFEWPAGKAILEMD